MRDGLIHVADQFSDVIATFALDPDTGVPGEQLDALAAAAPTCLVAVPAHVAERLAPPLSHP